MRNHSERHLVGAVLAEHTTNESNPAADDKTVYLWNAHTGEHLRTLTGKNTSAMELA